MKVERAAPAFAPVIIRLETQEEVDAVWGMLNYSPILDLLNKFMPARDLWGALDSHVSEPGGHKVWQAFYNQFSAVKSKRKSAPTDGK